MRPVEQTKVDGLGGGNCVAACIASIFEVDIETVTVPCGGSYSAVCAWTECEHPGLYPISKQWDNAIVLDDVAWPEPFRTYWIATVRSPRTDGGHCVVMYGSEMVWDPHPMRDQGFGPCIGSLHWIIRDPALVSGRSAAEVVMSG